MSHGEEVSLMPKGVLDLKTEVPAPIKKVQSSLQLPSKEAFEEVVATCWATLLATGAAIMRYPFWGILLARCATLLVLLMLVFLVLLMLLLLSGLPELGALLYAESGLMRYLAT